MNRRNSGKTVAALVATAALIACSERSPIAPDVSSESPLGSVQSSPGSYVISFMVETSTGLVAVADDTPQPVGTYLVLKSEVRDINGNLATVGTVKYEVCWSQGAYAPKAACESGNGRWKPYLSVSVDPVGSLVGFGSCSTPRTIGFRFSYSSKGSGIASGTSAAKDFQWMAAI